MAKYLRIEPARGAERGELGGSNYLLPADVDLDGLAREISQSMTNDASLVVEIEMGDTPLPRHRLVINCALIDSVLLSESAEPDA